VDADVGDDDDDDDDEYDNDLRWFTRIVCPATVHTVRVGLWS
jgi:hypothetical protein